MTTVRVLGIVLAGVLALGVAMEVVEHLSARYLRSRVVSSYAVVASLQPGTTREVVESRLRAASATAGQMFVNRQDSNLLHFVVNYSLIEACGFALRFHEGRLIELYVGDQNQPGPCPGGPASWKASGEVTTIAQ
jgi:hypothetical protein